MILVIDDDKLMAKCIARACGEAEVQICGNAIEAMGLIENEEALDLIFLDILLDGPDGFTLLNELVSYPDTAKIPIVIVSSLRFRLEDLEPYGVVGVLNKDEMTPQEIKRYVREYAK